MRKRVLFVCGTLHQTTMLHQIGEAIADAECFYTPFYLDGILRFAGPQAIAERRKVRQEYRKQVRANGAPQRAKQGSPGFRKAYGRDGSKDGDLNVQFIGPTPSTECMTLSIIRIKMCCSPDG